MATRYWVGGGSSQNWNATGNTNWGTASGVQDNASVPTSTDDVIFDGAGVGGNSNSTISATITIQSLTITAGYTSTMTHNAELSIAGNLTLNNTYTIAGTSRISITATATITSNGKTWPNDFRLVNSSTTRTFVGDFTILGTLINSGRNNVVNATTNERIISNGFTTDPLNSTVITGTITHEITGGTISTNLQTTWSFNELILNGNITISSAQRLLIASGIITYQSGTITTTASTLSISNVTLNTNGIIWNNVVFGGGTSILTSNLTISGILTVSATTTINRTTAETITLAGGMTMNERLLGTADITITGGTWSGNTAGRVETNLTIAGNITLSGTNCRWGGSGKTLLYSSGTVTTTGSTLTISTQTAGVTVTLNVAPITFNNVTIGGGLTGCTVVLASDLNMTGLLGLNNYASGTNVTTTEKITTSGGVANLAYGGGGNAPVYVTGGSMSGGISMNVFLNGNITLNNGYTIGGLLTYLSGNIICVGTQTFGSCTLDTEGMFWNNITQPGSGGFPTVTLLSNLNILGRYTQPAWDTTINTSTGKSMNVYGGFVTAGATQGNATINVYGGTLTISGSMNNPLNLYGNITIEGAIRKNAAGINNYANIKTINANLQVQGSMTITGLSKAPFKFVTVTAGQTLTVDQLPVGTEESICQFSSTGANYTIAFLDSFEKIGRNVALSGATVSRPGQLLVTTNPRFNTNRSTNGAGIRYVNQSPGGFPKNNFPIGDRTLTGIQGGLQADPCFVRQG